MAIGYILFYRVILYFGLYLQHMNWWIELNFWCYKQEYGCYEYGLQQSSDHEGE